MWLDIDHTLIISATQNPLMFYECDRMQCFARYMVECMKHVGYMLTGFSFARHFQQNAQTNI